MEELRTSSREGGEAKMPGSRAEFEAVPSQVIVEAIAVDAIVGTYKNKEEIVGS